MVIRLKVSGLESLFTKGRPKPKRKLLPKQPKGFFANKYRFKFGWTPFPEFKNPDPSNYAIVLERLRVDLAKKGILLDRASGEIVGAPQGPMHAGGEVTVDAFVKVRRVFLPKLHATLTYLSIKVIMSQATNNHNAITAQERLVKAFPYTVNGEQVPGKYPNYHAIRVAELPRLKDVLSAAGLQNGRAENIQAMLQSIHEKNQAQKNEGWEVDVNPPNAPDFVPGSLCLNYLDKMDKETKMNELLSYRGIGVKTTACILCFNYDLPVFAVDTHVFRLAKWLQWIPEDCNRDQACLHLDKFIPDDIKFALHQAFWHHGQNCSRCKARADPKSGEWRDAECVIEEFVQQRLQKTSKPSPKKRKVSSDDYDNADDIEKPKPKVRKGNKSKWVAKALTHEEAEAEGYRYEEFEINDGFFAPGTNVTGTKKARFYKRVESSDGTKTTFFAEVAVTGEFEI